MPGGSICTHMLPGVKDMAGSLADSPTMVEQLIPVGFTRFIGCISIFVPHPQAPGYMSKGPAHSVRINCT